MELAPAATGLEQVRDDEAIESPRARVRRVFESAADALYRFIALRVGDDHAAEDLLQQACCEAVAGVRRAPTSDADCEAWLFGIARNLIRRRWRMLKRRGAEFAIGDPSIAAELSTGIEHGTLSTAELERREVRDQLMLAVTALPAADQALIFAFYFEGRTQVEIARTSGGTAKSVESRLYRVRHRLRERLARMERNGGS